MIYTTEEFFYVYDIPKMIFQELAKDYGDGGPGSEKILEGSNGSLMLRLIAYNIGHEKINRKVVAKTMKGIICLHSIVGVGNSFYFMSGDMLRKDSIAIEEVAQKALIRVFWKTTNIQKHMDDLAITFPQRKLLVDPNIGHIISRVISLSHNAKADSRLRAIKKFAQ